MVRATAAGGEGVSSPAEARPDRRITRDCLRRYLRRQNSFLEKAAQVDREPAQAQAIRDRIRLL